MKSGNREAHYSHWTILPDRFTVDDLAEFSSEIPPEHEIAASDFYCTAEENEVIK